MTAVRTMSVALVGNPNAGKSTLFNALSGLRQRTGNYPGVTVEVTRGHWRTGGLDIDLIDLPGTYSLAARSPDEQLAVDLLLGRAPGEPAPDVIIAVVDASNLDRHLYLVTQLFELARPVVIALNMIDVASKLGIHLDVPALSARLGVAVVPIQANRGKGLAELAAAVTAAAELPLHQVSYPAIVDDELRQLSKQCPGVPAFELRRLLFDAGGCAERRFVARFGSQLGEDVRAARHRLAAAGHPIPAAEARARYAWIRQTTGPVVLRPEHPPVSATDRIDRIVTHKLWGTVIFLLVMAGLFQLIFTAAIPAMDVIKAGKDALGGWVAARLPPGPVASLLVDGIIEGVGSVVVFLPQILILFAALALLEDCGYMARAAFLMDKLMAKAGLSGKSFIPMLSSIACAIPGIMATRTIENRRDRFATIMVAPLMSCSARLPVYILLVAAFLTEGHAWWVPGATVFLMYLVGVALAPVVAWTLKRTLLRGPTPLFVMEMPKYQWPSTLNVVTRVLDRGKAFLFRAGTFILASMVLVWALLYFPSTDATGQSYDLRLAELRQQLDSVDDESKPELEQRINNLNGEWRRQSWLGRVGHWIEPAVKPLGWDWKIGMAAVASFPAREVVVGVLGQIYNLGRQDADALQEPLGQALKDATWHDEPGGERVFGVPTALSLMVFFALCCQCASTLAVIRRETGTWRWPAFTFGYMTALAYLGALIVYQVGSRL